MNWNKYLEDQFYFCASIFIGIILLAFLYSGIIELFKGSQEEFNWYSLLIFLPIGVCIHGLRYSINEIKKVYKSHKKLPWLSFVMIIPMLIMDFFLWTLLF